MKATLVKSTGMTSTTTVNAELFGASVNRELLSQAIRVYLSNQRQGTSLVKNRAEVVRTKRKWYKQKGTGNARHGARSAPLFVGGGVAHGPKGLTDWRRSLPTALKNQALISALSAQSAQLIIHEGIEKVKKTADAQKLIMALKKPANTSFLLVLPETNLVVVRSFRNLPNVQTTTAHRLNALIVSRANNIILTPDTLQALEFRLLPAKAKKIVKTQVLDVDKNNKDSKVVKK